LYTKDIVAYVTERFEVKYSIPGMTGWLHAHGFSYKKPAVVPGKANKDAQEQWLKEYENLKANLSADEAICFTDGVHPTHNMKLTYGWIRKGERKEIPTNSGLKGCGSSCMSAFSTINIMKSFVNLEMLF